MGNSQWTTETPTEEGWYWFVYSYKQTLQRIVQIKQIAERLVVLEGQSYIDSEYRGEYEPETLSNFIEERGRGTHYWIKLDVPPLPGREVK
jgi:hypothetical protein